MESTPPQLDPELLAEIKKLHFQTKRLADENLMDSYKSAFRGTGIEFEEVREYLPGDDIRSIDWKVTARTGTPFIKSFREERELTVLIAVDVSASTHTGTRGQLREELIAKVGAVLTLIALGNNDKVGLLTFSDIVESYHPPRKARSAVWRILHEVLMPRSSKNTASDKTNTAELFSFISRVMKRRAIIFVISDFLELNFEDELASVAKRHDLTVMPVVDPSDFQLPAAGLLKVVDPETGAERLIDSGNPTVQDEYRKRARDFFIERERIISQTRCRHLESADQ